MFIDTADECAIIASMMNEKLSAKGVTGLKITSEFKTCGPMCCINIDPDIVKQ